MCANEIKEKNFENRLEKLDNNLIELKRNSVSSSLQQCLKDQVENLKEKVLKNLNLILIFIF